MADLASTIADVSTANLDAASDDPKQARSDLLDLTQKFNQLLGILDKNDIVSDPSNDSGGLDVGGGLSLDNTTSPDVLKISLIASDSVTMDFGSL
mgnify:CR=1 FL=1